MYRFRYRSRNINGNSSWSPVVYIKAATAPSRPPSPLFKTATSTSVTLYLYSSTETRGGEITALEVWRNGGGNSLVFTKLASLPNSAKEYEIVVADHPGMVVGTIYKFKVRTENDHGVSEYSDEIDAAASSFPAKPNAPTQILAESSTNYITLQWSMSADTELPVLGYAINMDDGNGGNFKNVYYGKNYPNVLKYTIGGLTTGLTYSFKLQVINFNGLSAESEPSKFIICVPPLRLAPPVMAQVTKTTMLLTWGAPNFEGGCPVRSFSIFKDDGAGGSFTEVDPTQVNNIPALRQYSVSFDAADTSKIFRFYITAINIIGSVQSDTVSYKLAAQPNKPTDPPRLNLDETRINQIQVDYDPLSEIENGGSKILSYEIAIYNDTTSLW